MQHESEEVQSLSARISELQAQLAAAVDARKQDFVTTVNQSAAVAAEVDQLSAQLAALEHSIRGEDGVAARFQAAEKSGAEIALLQAVLEALRVVCQLQQGITAFDDAVEAGDVRQAASVLHDSEDNLSTLRTLQAGESANITRILTGHVSRRRALLSTRVLGLWNKAIEVQPRSIVVSTRVAAARLRDVIAALQDASMLDGCVTALAAKLRTGIMQSLLSPTSDVSVSSSSAEHHSELQLVVQAQQQPRVPRPEDVFNRLIQFAKFLCEATGDVSDALLPRLGSSLWSEIAKTIESDWLQPSVPDTVEALQKYESVVTQTREFEARMLDFGLAGGDQALSAFVNDMPARFVASRRQAALVHARTILLTVDSGTVTVPRPEDIAMLTGEDLSASVAEEKQQQRPSRKSSNESGLFRLPKMAVTSTAASIVDVVYRLMRDACLLPAAAAEAAFHGARDVLDLFRALAPYARSAALIDGDAPNHQQAALLRNDCWFIAHHLLTLGHRFKYRLPESLGHTVMFIDMIPLFRELGTQQLEDAVRALCARIEQVLGKSGLQDARMDTRQKAIEDQMRNAAHVLQQVKRGWQPLLPATVYANCMGLLLDSALNVVLTALLRLPSIGPEDARGLSYALVPLLKCDVLDENEKLKHVRTYAKIEAARLVLEASDAETLQRRINANEVQALAADDVRRLARAMYPDAGIRVV
eukprot:TRINITY_DN14962_c0_g1_i1.p1 TRINITY_DN14962_c0_g1~~TRINITY_DN14962_c0_g1_i1.p1  ORF type:complete len:703 (-),score=222.08 TRINITY_DN14962_c0_g1_i1:80-2188(-)